MLIILMYLNIEIFRIIVIVHSEKSLKLHTLKTYSNFIYQKYQLNPISIGVNPKK